MLRRINIITTAALALACALPASAAMAQQDLRSPDTRDAARESAVSQASSGSGQDLRSPDARDAALQSAISQASGGSSPEPLPTPDERDAANLTHVETSTPTVQVSDQSSGSFDWSDAGIGAAGMLALLSIAAGSMLVVTRRRQRVELATH